MSFKYIKNCLTCEFGFDNDNYDEEYNPVHPEQLKITCAGNTDLYGKEVYYKSICEYWSVSLEEFIRGEKKISYNDFYKDKLNLLEKQMDLF